MFEKKYLLIAYLVRKFLKKLLEKILLWASKVNTLKQI